MIEFYRRIHPRLSITRLVDGKTSEFIGFRVNLWFWALEVVVR